MIEHEIGETFTFTDENTHTLTLLTEEVNSGSSCEGCYLYENNLVCLDYRYQIGDCHAQIRMDERFVIFREVKE